MAVQFTMVNNNVAMQFEMISYTHWMSKIDIFGTCQSITTHGYKRVKMVVVAKYAQGLLQ